MTDTQYPNTYQAVRVIDGPSERTHKQNLLYVEWCTGEQELYNMTVDPHQIHNLLAASGSAPTATEQTTPTDLLPLVRELSHIVGKLGNCTGPMCHDLFESDITDSDGGVSDKRRLLYQLSPSASFESIQASIRNRLPCHNPPEMVEFNDVDTNRTVGGRTSHHQIGRKPFAVDRHIPQPFEHGFPFSDADCIDEGLLLLWEEHYAQYFYS